MHIDVKEAKNVTVVALSGDLDLGAADSVRRNLADTVDGGASKLVVDLSAVAYIDSSGLGALVAGMKHARAAGGDLKLCGLQPDVQYIFEMTRLIKVMDVHGTRDDAIAAWG